MSKIKIVFALIVVSLFSGCATTFEKQAYNSELHKDIENVGLITVQMPAKAMVDIAAHPGDNFGLIGGLIAAGDRSGKTQKFGEAIAAAGFDFNSYFNESLKKAFADTRYKISDVPVTREAKYKFMDTYPLDTNQDALLDIYVYNLGYGAAGALTDYYPTVHIHARMVKADTGEAIFADKVLYNPYGHSGEALVIDPNTEFAYKKFNLLMDDTENAVIGIKQAIDAVTKELVAQL